MVEKIYDAHLCPAKHLEARHKYQLMGDLYSQRSVVVCSNCGARHPDE